MALQLEVKNAGQLGEELLLSLRSGQSYGSTVRIKCQDSVDVPAHRNVLEAACPYFANLFAGKKNNEIVVNAPCSSAVANLILEFIYTNRTTNFKEHQATELFSAAEIFGLDELKAQVEKFVPDATENADEEDSQQGTEVAKDTEKRQSPLREETEVSSPTTQKLNSSPRVETLATLTDGSLVSIVNGQVTNLEPLKEPLATAVGGADYCALSNGKVFIYWWQKRFIKVFDFKLGSFLYSIDLGAELNYLRASRGRLYALVKRIDQYVIYEIIDEKMEEIACFKRPINGFAVLEHEGDNLRLVYSDMTKLVYFDRIDGEQKQSEVVFKGGASIFVHYSHDERIFVSWKSPSELGVIRDRKLESTYRHSADWVISTFNTELFYLKHSGNVYEVVDATTRQSLQIGQVKVDRWIKVWQ